MKQIVAALLPLFVAEFAAHGEPINPRPEASHADWISVPVPVLDASESVTHMGHLLDAPAGKRGFVEAREGHFHFADGGRARFWGTNLTFDGALPPKEKADAVAARLAKLGYNMVRLHHLDTSAPPRGIIDYESGRSTELDESRMVRLDHLVAALARRGIYYDLNLHVGRQYFVADGLPAPLSRKQKVATNFVERLLVLQEEMATLLLTRVNVATGVRYCDDPAMALVELTNESSMFSGLVAGAFDGKGPAALPTPYKTIYDGLWSAWLRERYGGDAGLLEAWGAGALLPDESLTRGSVRSPHRRALARMNRARLEDSLRFISEIQLRAHRRLAEHVRSLGVRVPITGTHHYDVLPGLWAQAQMDYVDTHGYWNPPTGKGRNQRIVSDASMIANAARHNEGFGYALTSPIPRWALSKVAGKPMTVSEWNHCWPDRHSYELIPLAAAYADYHDWDGMMHFAYAQTVARATQPGPIEDPFSSSRSVVDQALMPLASLIYHRVDIAPAPSPFVLHHDPARFYVAADRLLASEGRHWWGKQVPWEIGLVRRVERSFEGGGDDAPFVLGDRGELATDTGQIRWRIDEEGRKGHVEIAAPRAAGLIGAIGGRELSAGALRAAVDVDCALLAVSLDDEPISRAKRILVAVVSEERNQGQRIADGRLVRLGQAPVETRLVRGSFGFEREPDALAMDATALDLTGATIAPVPLRRVGARIEVVLGAVPAVHFLLEAKNGEATESRF